MQAWAIFDLEISIKLKEQKNQPIFPPKSRPQPEKIERKSAKNIV